MGLLVAFVAWATCTGAGAHPPIAAPVGFVGVLLGGGMRVTGGRCRDDRP